MSKGKKDGSTETLFADIAQFVADSRALLDKGAMMELAGLDASVKRLCDEVLRLSQDDRVRYADRLQELLSELTALGEAMVAQRDRLGQEMRDIAQHKKASVAYRTSDAIDDFGEKGEE